MPERPLRRTPSPPPTIRDVARRARVSTATVSRHVAGLGVVSGVLGARVRAAVEALGYRPNRVARSLRSRRSQIVGVIIPNIQNPFFTAAVRGIEDQLQKEGFTLVLGNSDDRPARERSYLNLFRDEGVSGLILVPGRENLEAYQAAVAAGLPLVTIDRSLPQLPVDGVEVANRDGAAEAIRHLVRAGHRRIGLITGPAGISTATERLEGYHAALAEAGVRRDAALVHRVPFRPEGGAAAARKLLDLSRPVSAIFAGADMIALGVLRAVNERKLRVPEDVALVTFDDMIWAAAMQPPLTAVAQPAYELGTTAARLLIERTKNPGRAPRRIRLNTRLVARASCGARPSSSPEVRS